MDNRETFKYKIELSYMYNDKLLTFDYTNIKGLVVDYNYIDLNMPIIMIRLALDKNIIDDLIDNESNKSVILTISKYVENAQIKIYRDYIKEEFTYIIAENKNTTKELDYGNSNTLENKKDIQPVQKLINIGLINQRLINNNKKFINNIFNQTSIANIIYYYSQNMKLLVEPITNYTPRNFIIPPLDSFTNLIKYIDDNVGLYKDHNYILFYDLDKTYLISDAGLPIKSKDELMSSVLINIHKTIVDESKIRGLRTNTDVGAYMIDIDNKDVTVMKNDASNIAYEKTVTINSDGKTNVFNTHNDRIRLERTHRNVGKATITDKDIVINIFKSDLDSSVFTINKEYNIKNFAGDPNIDGRFILIRKKEIYIVNNEDFNILNIFTLKKINPST